MGPGEPRESDREGARHPPEDTDFLFERDADPSYSDGSAYGEQTGYDDGPRYAKGPAFADGPAYADGPAFASGPAYADGPAYASGSAYAGDSTGYGAEGGGPRLRGRGPGFLPPEFTEEELEGLQADDTGLARGSRRVLPLEDEPTSLVARYLFPTERYRGEWKRHWVHLSTPLLIFAGATLVLGYLAGFLATQQVESMITVAVLLWIGVAGWVGWKVWDWYFDRFILTNKRVMVVSGIVTRKVAMMPLLRVTDMKYEQSALGRMLNYGTFVLESAGQDQALREVKHLPNPNELYLRVVEEMYEPQAVEARLGKDGDADDGA